MRILVFSTNGLKNDGITSWLIQQFAQMDRHGLDVVDTLTFDGSDEAVSARVRAAGLRVHRVPPRSRRPLAYMRALRRLIRENRYDIVHINGNSATTALDLFSCLGTGTKARIVHSRNTHGEHPVVDKALRPAMAALTTHRLACGHDAGRWLFGDREFEIIPNGRDFASYRYSEEARRRMREALGLAESSIAVGHVGNFNPQKNHRFLVEAFARAVELNPHLKLILVGDGPLRGVVTEQVRERGLEGDVFFTGRSTAVGELTSAFDVGVLPSLYEGFPNVVVEWQVSGLPGLVSTSVTRECALTDLVSFVPGSSLDAWSGALAAVVPVDRAKASAEALPSLIAGGFEAGASAQKLREYYFSIEREATQAEGGTHDRP